MVFALATFFIARWRGSITAKRALGGVVVGLLVAVVSSGAGQHLCDAGTPPKWVTIAFGAALAGIVAVSAAREKLATGLCVGLVVESVALPMRLAHAYHHDALTGNRNHASGTFWHTPLTGIRPRRKDGRWVPESTEDCRMGRACLAEGRSTWPAASLASTIRARKEPVARVAGRFRPPSVLRDDAGRKPRLPRTADLAEAMQRRGGRAGGHHAIASCGSSSPGDLAIASGGARGASPRCGVREAVSVAPGGEGVHTPSAASAALRRAPRRPRHGQGRRHRGAATGGNCPTGRNAEPEGALGIPNGPTTGQEGMSRDAEGADRRGLEAIPRWRRAPSAGIVGMSGEL